MTCPCCYGLVCVVYITCLSSLVSWAPTWDYHCILLVQGALFSVPDVWVCWAVLVCWCHHKCFHLALTEWSECPTPCCLLWPPWCGEVPHSKICWEEVWENWQWQHMFRPGHSREEARCGWLSPFGRWICHSTELTAAVGEYHPLHYTFMCRVILWTLSHPHSLQPGVTCLHSHSLPQK